MRIIATISACLVLAVAGCGDDDDDDDAQPEATGETTATTAGDTTTTGGEAAGGVTVGLAPDECVDLEEAADGVYPVDQAGEVEVSRDGETLTLVEARPVEGWQAGEDDADDDDEVEVEFRGDGIEIDFEAEIDDGRMEIDVCRDDD